MDLLVSVRARVPAREVGDEMREDQEQAGSGWVSVSAVWQVGWPPIVLVPTNEPEEEEQEQGQQQAGAGLADLAAAFRPHRQNTHGAPVGTVCQMLAGRRWAARRARDAKEGMEEGGNTHHHHPVDRVLAPNVIGRIQGVGGGGKMMMGMLTCFRPDVDGAARRGVERCEMCTRNEMVFLNRMENPLPFHGFVGRAILPSHMSHRRVSCPEPGLSGCADLHAC